MHSIFDSVSVFSSLGSQCDTGMSSGVQSSQSGCAHVIVAGECVLISSVCDCCKRAILGLRRMWLLQEGDSRAYTSIWLPLYSVLDGDSIPRGMVLV